MRTMENGGRKWREKIEELGVMRTHASRDMVYYIITMIMIIIVNVY